MEFAPRDVRHLKGSTPRVDAPPLSEEGLLVGFQWRRSGAAEAAPVATLTVRPDAAPDRIVSLPLDGAFDLEVLPERCCVGRWVDGVLLPCPQGRAADRFDQCVSCHPLGTRRECVFEPSCTDCVEPLCITPHRIYVAFYGELPKIGMTRSARGETRQVEQGADAYGILAHTPDRFAARRLEDRLSRALQVPQWRRAEDLLPRLARPVPWDRIEAAYATLGRQSGDLIGEAPGPLERITAHPGAFPLPSVPVLAGLEGRHRGTVLGIKGKYLAYQARPDGPIWALNLHGVVSHRVRFEAPPSDA